MVYLIETTESLEEGEIERLIEILPLDDNFILPLLKADRQLEPGLRHELVSMLFDSPRSLAIGAAAGCTAGLCAVARAGDALSVALGAALAAVGLGRVVHALVEQERARRSGRHARAELYYEIGAWLFSGLLGLLAFAVLTRTDDAGLHLLVPCVAIGYAAGICARNAGRPKIALAQLALAALPISPALALSDDPVLWVLAGVIFFYVIGLADVTRKTFLAFQSAVVASRAREEELRQMLDHLPQLLWIANPAGDFVYHSRRWKDFTGFDLSELGHSRTGLIHLEDQASFFMSWRRCLKSGSPCEIKYRLRHKSGEYRWMLSRAQPEQDENGRIVRWHGVCVDIHDALGSQPETDAGKDKG